MHQLLIASVDGDSVTVYFNGQIVAYKQILTEKAIKLSLTADKTGSNTLVMYADNLGSIPPNTSVMKIYADGKVYEIFMRADLNSNAIIRFTMGGKRK